MYLTHFGFTHFPFERELPLMHSSPAPEPRRPRRA
jgi:hypothetical protein